MSRDVWPIDESYWVIPGRFRAGRYPALFSEIITKKTLNGLLEQGINFIIDLTVDGEEGIHPYLGLLQCEAEKNCYDVNYHHRPIRDFSVPTKEVVTGILDEIDTALEKGKNIYLHCQGGRGRTGLIVGCYLARHGTTGNHALTRLQFLRREMPGGPGSSPETVGQKRMVMEWKKGQ